MKTTAPARSQALMAEQAEWNRFIDAACFIEEERLWVDFMNGQRDDGTLRSFAYLGCVSAARTERVLYARSLASGGTAALAKRVEERQGDGASVKDAIADIAARAAAFAKSPPARSPAASGRETADFSRIAREAEAMKASALSLAASTCGGWPELAAALGGKEACAPKAELYYYAQGNAPSAP